MPDKQLGSDIELTRTTTGSIRCHVTADDLGGGSFDVRGYSTSFVGNSGVSAGFWQEVVGGVPKLFVGIGVGVPWTDEIVVDLGNLWAADDITPNAFDETWSFSIEESITCDKWAGIPTQSGGGAAHSDSIFNAYADDYDPAGMPPQQGEIWYEPVADGESKCWLHVTITLGEETPVTVDIEIDPDDYRHGLGPQQGYIQTDQFQHSPGTPSYALPFDDEEAAGGFDLGGNGTGGTYNATADDSSFNQYSHASVTDGAVTYYTRGRFVTAFEDFAFSCELILTCPAFTMVYNGTLEHWDGTDVAGPYTIRVLGEDTSSNPIEGNGSNGTFALTKEFAGIWSFGYDYSATYGELIETDDDGGLYNATRNSVTLGTLGYTNGITNCRDIGEPDYPFADGWDPSITWNWLQYNDSRIELPFAELSWANPIDFSIPMSKEVVSFDYGDTWAVDAGAATFSDAGDGHIRISVTANSTTVSSDYSGNTLAGARYALIEYESDDTEPITIEIDGRQYEITPTPATPTSDDWTDLIAPTNQATGSVDDNQSARINGATWGWGIHDAGTIKLIGLRSGKHYDIKTITLQRLDDEFQVHLFRCPFVAAVPGSSRQGDDQSLYDITDTGDTTYITRIGLIIVDGIVAAELFGMAHVFQAGTPGTWIHDNLLLNDSNFIYPDDGLVDITINDATIEADYLPQGFWSYEATAWSPAMTGYCSSLELPPDEADRTFTFTKWFRGRPLLRVINRLGAAGTGTLETYLLTTEAPIDTESVTIPVSGIVMPESKPQPIMRWAEVVSGSGDTYVLDGLDRDYTGFTLYAKELAATVTPMGVEILSHNTGTGEVVLNHTFSPSLAAEAEVAVHLPYSYKLIAGGQELTVETRNRALVLATMMMRIGTGLLLYDATASTGKLLYDPANGQLLYDA